MEATCYIEPLDRSVSVGRHFVADHLQDWGYGDTDTAALLVSELVSNAVRYASALIALRVMLDEQGVTVEVSDDSEELPIIQEVDLGSQHGRGLFLVDALAQKWGCRESPDRSKTVWFQLGA